MSSLTINVEEIKEKLIERLKVSGWAGKLKGFVHSSDFDMLLQRLVDAREDGKRFTPPLKHVFNAFEKCPYHDLRVVIIGQDPYPQLGVADGLAFSCSLTGTAQPSLKFILEAVQKTVPEEYQDPFPDADLTRWAEQGVLLLNSALTTEIGKPATHYDIWEPFLAYVLDIINNYNNGMIFVLLGKKAQEFESILNEDMHHIIKVSHPASAAYTGSEWNCNDMFNRVNEIIENANGPEYCIRW